MSLKQNFYRSGVLAEMKPEKKHPERPGELGILGHSL
jgi:hypothetical protein